MARGLDEWSRRSLEVSGTPWLFSFYYPDDILNQIFDHVFVRTSGVKENWPRELGHMMMNEDDS